MSKWAKCNYDGKPIHPDDQAAIDKFMEWLTLTSEQRQEPKWLEYAGIKVNDD